MAKKIVWSDEARADVRAIDRATAIWLLQGLARFAFTESGDGLDEAKADVRTLDQPTAMRIFEGILHFARSGAGDVVALQ